MEKQKTYTCIFCGSENKMIGIAQKETHYYSVFLETNQWKDLDIDATSSKYFCMSCDKNITDKKSIEKIDSLFDRPQSCL